MSEEAVYGECGKHPGYNMVNCVICRAEAVALKQLPLIIYCINTEYDAKAMEYFAKNKVKLPKADTPYTIKEVIVVRGEYTILLNELRNKQPKPDVAEASFHYSRFSDKGPGEVLDWETVDRIYKRQLMDVAASESGLF